MSARAVRSIGIALVILAQAAIAGAQPGPEHKKLDFLAGKWRVEMDIKGSSAAAASKASGTENCEWFANLHVVCKGEATGAAGLYSSMRIISYIPSVKSYAQYSVDSIGYALLSFGQIDGSTWTFTSEVGGVKLRNVIKASKDRYTSKSEYAGADGKWVTTSETKATRMK